MAATKVGMREFRAGLADYIASDSPVAVTRHGQTVGYFIPTRSDLEAELATLRSAVVTLDALLTAHHVDVDEVVSEFKDVRLSPSE